MVVAAAAFGIGWTNSGADYSRYLPRGSSGKAIVGWTTFAGSLMPVVLVVYGLMLVTSNPALASELGDNPIGTLVSLLPTSALILLPFLLVLSLGTTGSGAMDLYSSGLTLLTLGLKVPRAVAAGLDGVLMIFGSLYLLWSAGSFFVPFESFLIFLGVPLAVVARWVGQLSGARSWSRAGIDLARVRSRGYCCPGHWFCRNARARTCPSSQAGDLMTVNCCLRIARGSRLIPPCPNKEDQR